MSVLMTKDEFIKKYSELEAGALDNPDYDFCHTDGIYYITDYKNHYRYRWNAATYTFTADPIYVESDDKITDAIKTLEDADLEKAFEAIQKEKARRDYEQYERTKTNALNALEAMALKYPNAGISLDGGKHWTEFGKIRQVIKKTLDK